MKVRVLDASVLVAGLFPEQQTKAALNFLAQGHQLAAPDLIYAEIANVVWKRCRRGEISPEKAVSVLEDVLGLPIEATACGELAKVALPIALTTGRSVYDCLYLALAVKLQSPFVTADKKFVNALARTPFASSVLCLG